MIRENTLITGGAGFIGSHLVKCLYKNTNDIIYIVDNLSTGNINNIPNEKVRRKRKGRIVFNNINLKDYNTNIHFKEIYHLVPNNIESALNLTTTNDEEFPNTKLFFFSNSSVYGENNWALEEDDLKPVTPEGEIKLLQEQTIKKYFENKPNCWMIIRSSTVYGENQNIEKENGIISIIINSLKTGKLINLYNDGNVFKDFIHVFDLMDAILKLNVLINKGQGNSGVYNVSNGTMIKIKDLIDRFKINYRNKGFKKEPIYTRQDNTLLKQLGWKPKIDVIKYIEDKISGKM